MTKILSGRGASLAFGAMLLAGSSLMAQRARLVVQPQVLFDTTLADSHNLQSASLLWTGSSALALDSAITFPITGTGAALSGPLRGMPFTVISTPASLQPNVAAGLQVQFQPSHNIDNNSEVVICSGALPGCMSIDLKGRGRYAEAYWRGTENLSEQPLRMAMKRIVAVGYTQLGYNGARDRMFMDIDNKRVNGEGATVNTLECVYTGRLSVDYTDRSQSQSRDNFNTEHTMPQSTFGSANPMVSDLHHLFPTDEVANSTRNNWPYDTVANPSTTLPGGSKYGSGHFEPRDVHKGKAARALLYFATRYHDYNGFIAGMEPTLRRWSRNHLPVAQEVKRNDLVQQYQHNRNPYSDHEELIDRITFISDTTRPMAELNTFRYFPGAAENLTVNLGDTLRIYAAVVNTGNQQMTLTNPVLPSADWSLEGPAAPPVVQPGEAFNAVLRFVPTRGGSVVSNFQFLVLQGTTGGATVQIPLSVDVITGIAGSLTGKVRVWPGIFSDRIQYSTQQPSTVGLYDLQGRALWSATKTAEGVIPTERLAAGSYLVRVSGPEGSKTFTVVK